ncbi:FG-GAP-like repeat-containing protein [Streptomyces sp. NPDC055400]
MRLRTTTALAALVAAGLTPLTLPSAPASATPSGLQGDFNGDGYRDLAVSAPAASVGGAGRAGTVVTLYGSASGITADHRKVISQNSSGVPGSAEKNDVFASATATGDFNGDGYADLAVGTPGEDVGDDTDGGTVTLLWGSASGLSGGTTVPDPAPTKHDDFGQSLAAGDFNGDGRTDLAIGSTGTAVWIYKGGMTKAGGNGGKLSLATTVDGNGHGVYQLASGDLNGDGTSDLAVGGMWSSLVYESGPDGLTLAASLDDGDSTNRQHLAIGDITGDGYDDFVFGNPYDLNGWASGGGSVNVFRGGVDGISAEPNQVINQSTSGIPGPDEYEDAFGSAVSVGDITGDGLADVAIGSSDESIGSATTTGQVFVLRGTPTGLATSGVQNFHQDSAGIPGANEDVDRFGWAVQLTDVNADNRADLFIGAQNENAGAGALWYLRGPSAGAGTSGVVSYGPGSVGLSSTGGDFGSVLTG